MSARYLWRFALAGCAVGCGIVSWPSAWVEQHYSRGFYPPLQRLATGVSNLMPIALLDILIIVVVCGALFGLTRAIRGGRGRAWLALWRVFSNVIAGSAATYLCFLGTWGLNYQREPVTLWLDFDEQRVSPESARTLIDAAVARLASVGNDGLAADASSADWVPNAELRRSFATALREIGLKEDIVPGRPKYSMLDPYFIRAGVSGMTDPFFLETLTASNLLPFERPAVVAHEWAHLAGLARESEASFVGWLACIHGDAAAQYSGWFDVFLRVMQTADESERKQVVAALPARVRDDLRAMSQRNERDQVRLVGRFAWRAYDTYLKSNRVTGGVRNYGEVVRLILGTRFEREWRPVIRRQTSE